MTINNVQDLLKDADYMGLTNIKDKCLEFLHSNEYCVNFRHAFEIYRLGDPRGYDRLMKRCRQLMRNYFMDISRTDEYHYLDFDLLKSMLSITYLYTESDQIFSGVMRWILHNVSERRGYLEDLLRLARLSDLTPGYLEQCFLEEEMAAAIKPHT